MNSSFLRRMALGCMYCALAACSQKAPDAGKATSSTPAAAGKTVHESWVANGATACDTYLTHDVVAAILTHPDGQIKKLSMQSCVYDNDAGGITITLANTGLAAFDSYQQYLVNPVPLAGVGDKASQSMIGIDAVKGNDRFCTVDAGGAPGSLKLHDAALGQKLGEICNTLFALP